MHGAKNYVPLKVKQIVWKIHDNLKNKEAQWGRVTGGLNDRKDMEGKFCSKPWDWFDIASNGDVLVCCKGWLGKPIGNYGKGSIAQIWDSRAAQELRKSILDGSFKYCNHDVCWHIQKNDLPDKTNLTNERHQRIVHENITITRELPPRVSLIYDRSCNLSCPSCRREMIYFKEGPEYERSRALHDKLMLDLFAEPHDKHLEISCTGTGDPFASPIFREFLFRLNGADFPNTIIHLTTNGILFTPPTWERMARIHNNIGNVIVSFDAATSETYQYTRRGGDFAKLLSNFAFLNELRASGAIKFLGVDFVVQQKNFREMKDFIRLAKGFGHVDSVGFAAITNWGTYSPKEFDQHAIWKADHPELIHFLDILRDPIFDDAIVDLKNLTAYREIARSRMAST